MPKPLAVWITTNWLILQEMGILHHLICFLRNVYAGQEATVISRHGKQPGSKSRKEYVKAVYCHPAYLTYMQNTSYEKPGWMKHKLELRLLGEISIISDTQMTFTLMAESKELKGTDGWRKEEWEMCSTEFSECSG